MTALTDHDLLEARGIELASEQEHERERRLRWRDVDLRQTWQVLAGAVFASVGLVLIVVGYVGAANSPLVAEQIPYLLSGGILGLALTILGGFLFWGHWLYRQYERDEHHQRRVTELLEALLADRADRPVPVAGNGAGARRPAPEHVDVPALVMTPTGSVVHRGDCAVVQHAGTVRPITPEQATAEDRRPCALCAPFGADAPRP